jgi:hypothetical protein
MLTRVATWKARDAARIRIGQGARGRMWLRVLSIPNRGFSSSERKRVDFTHVVSGRLHIHTHICIHCIFGIAIRWY